MKTFMIYSLLAACLGAVIWIVYRERTIYSNTVFYADTGLVPMSRGGKWTYGKNEGAVTLVWERGQPHSLLTSAHDWTERLSIEFPTTPKPGTHVLREADVRIGFNSYSAKRFWIIGKKGVEGRLKIVSQTPDQIVAEYDITVHANCSGRSPGFRDRKVMYNGRSRFYRRSRPEGVIAATGELVSK